MDRILTFVGSVVDSVFRIIDNVDATKKFAFEAGTQATASVLTLDVGAQTASRQITVPVLSANATLATLSAQTFTGVQTFSSRLIVGTSTDDGASTLQVSGQYRVYSDGVTGINRLTAFGASAYMALQTFSARGSRAAPSVSLSTDPIGDLSMGGCYDASVPSAPAFAGRAGVRGFTIQNWSLNNYGCRLEFYTTASGSASEVVQLAIAGNGDCVFASTTDATNTTTAALVLAGGLATAKKIIVGSSVVSTSVTTGALIVNGGAGIGGTVFIGTAMIVGTDPTGGQILRVGGALRINSATLISTATSFTNGSAAALGTLTNAPAAGNPTKWIPVDDNGTTRYIPSW